MSSLLAVKLDGLETTYLAVVILLGVAVFAAIIAQIIVVFGYWRGNRKQNSLGITGGEYARQILDKNGLYDVKVEKCGLLRTFLYGNHYSIAKKTVYLRMYTINKTSITSVVIAAQKAAIAQQCKEGDIKTLTRGKLQGLGIFGPILFVPLVVLGFVIDIFLFKTLLFSLIGAGVGLLFIAFGFVATLLNYSVEKEAAARAREFLAQDLTEAEMVTVKRILRSYLIEYLLQFIIAILRIIELVLKIFIKLRDK